MFIGEIRPRTAMDLAKSFFNVRDHEGYVGKEEHNVSTHGQVYSIFLSLSEIDNAQYDISSFMSL